ncbi:hypothetical protein AC31_4795, partial [Escherichia coli 3-073-06_S3_C2]
MDMICTAFSFQNPYTFPLTQLSQNTACCSTLLSVEHLGNDSNLLIVFYVQIMPDDFVMQL